MAKLLEHGKNRHVPEKRRFEELLPGCHEVKGRLGPAQPVTSPCPHGKVAISAEYR